MADGIPAFVAAADFVGYDDFRQVKYLAAAGAFVSSAVVAEKAGKHGGQNTNERHDAGHTQSGTKPAVRHRRPKCRGATDEEDKDCYQSLANRPAVRPNYHRHKRNYSVPLIPVHRNTSFRKLFCNTKY